MSRKLKPCPFCGSEAELMDALHIESDWWCASVMCTGRERHTCSVQMVCGASTKSGAVDAVVRAWNRREEDSE